MSEDIEWYAFGAHGKPVGLEHVLREHANSVFVFDADCVLGKLHVEVAVCNALRAFNRNKKIRTLGAWLSMYIGLSDQISTAKELCGVKTETENFVFIVFGNLDRKEILEKTGLKEDNRVMEFTKEKAMRIFPADVLLSTPEQMWQYLVCEKIALLSIS